MVDLWRLQIKAALNVDERYRLYRLMKEKKEIGDRLCLLGANDPRRAYEQRLYNLLKRDIKTILHIARRRLRDELEEILDLDIENMD